MTEYSLSDNEIRQRMLEYFFARNKNATSIRGKQGAAAKISDVKRDLKEAHGFTQQQVVGNLTYLISQGWVEEETVQKSITARGGTVIPSATSYYKITAAGIDKIAGPGEFTRTTFHGINIQASGQSIITLGDGNQINARFSDLGQSLSELRTAIAASEASEADKVDLVAEIETIQSQLGKHEPNWTIVTAAWESVKGAAALSGCADLVARIGGLLAGLL